MKPSLPILDPGRAHKQQRRAVSLLMAIFNDELWCRAKKGGAMYIGFNWLKKESESQTWKDIQNKSMRHTTYAPEDKVVGWCGVARLDSFIAASVVPRNWSQRHGGRSGRICSVGK